MPRARAAAAKKAPVKKAPKKVAKAAKKAPKKVVKKAAKKPAAKAAKKKATPKKKWSRHLFDFSKLMHFNKFSNYSFLFLSSNFFISSQF